MIKYKAMQINASKTYSYYFSPSSLIIIDDTADRNAIEARKKTENFCTVWQNWM